MSRRLQLLEKLAASGTADSFATYALAMEYQKLARLDDALATFRALRARDASYVPAYLMAGTLLAKLGRTEEAREWMCAGIDRARAAGDGKTALELEGALAELADEALDPSTR